MAITDLAGAIGDSLTTGNNAPGLAQNIFSYPGAANGVVSSPAPSVLGAATGPTYDPAAAANAAAVAQQAAAAGAINAGYGQVLNQYDQQLNDIPGQINDANAIVQSQYGAQQGSIDSAYGRGNANLNYARTDLGAKTDKSVADLANSIRQSFDSYSTLIGAHGGADSSATPQLSYALQKTQAQNRSDIYQNQNDQLGQIALKQGDLDAQHSDQLNQLNSWKSQQVISIGQQFKQAQQQIESAKAGANKDKLLALASLNKDLVNQAISALSGVEAQHQATTAAITNSLKQLQAPGNATALSSVDYTPTAAAQAAAPSISIGTGNTASPADSFVTPYYKKLATA